MTKALLTGHSRGLGAALAEQLLDRGIPVLALARSPNPELADRFGPLLTQVVLDLAKPPSLAAWLAGDSLGAFLADARQALLINNAGLLQPIGPAGSHSGEAIARAVALNVSAPLVLANAFIAATPACPDRRVLHISSGAARSAYAGWNVYCAGKAALDHHARAVALENIPALRIASIAPGVIDTAMQAEIRASSRDAFPQQARFVALKADGQLLSPAAAASRLLTHLLGEEFGRVVDGDLRQLAP